jgi:hypothetical protein
MPERVNKARKPTAHVQLRFVVWATFLLVPAVFAAVLLWLTEHSDRLRPHLPFHAWGGPERYEPAPQYRAARGSYPYSVVSGGVISGEEVEASIARDPIVAEHYRGVTISRLRPVRLNADIQAYTSFRTVAGIHWTAHAIRILKGELLLTDGTNLVRARCGNRLVFAPPPFALPGETPAKQKPPEAPPEIVLEYGLPPILTLPPSLPEMKVPPGSGRPPHFWPPAVPPIIWCCSVTAVPPSAVPTAPPTGPAVPEPTGLVLLATGTSMLAWWSWRRRQTLSSTRVTGGGSANESLSLVTSDNTASENST